MSHHDLWLSIWAFAAGANLIAFISQLDRVKPFMPASGRNPSWLACGASAFIFALMLFNWYQLALSPT